MTQILPSDVRAWLIVKRGDQEVARLPLDADADLLLGTSSQADLVVAGEPFLSRRHAKLRFHANRLTVEQLSTATNPVVFNGTCRDRFTVAPGEFFVVGSTAFAFQSNDLATSGGEPIEHAPSHVFTLGGADLHIRPDTTDRLRLLDLLKLPEVLRTRSRKDFFIYACGGLRMAVGAAYVQVVTIENDEPRVLCEDVSLDRKGVVGISRSLVRAALAEAPKPVTYSWQGSKNAVDLGATLTEGVDWAVCCAMPIPGEQPILLYVAGATVSDAGAHAVASQLSLRDTARLVGLIGDAIMRSIALAKLEDWQSKLGHFFSGKLVAKILESDDPQALAPHIRPATVMFFDIRGFSLLAEGNLERMLAHQGELRRAMSAMTQCIFDHDGVVIRYMGDGILACWNVPYDLPNHTEQACLAALHMVDLLNKVSDGWRCGIGIGCGPVVAGSLGSEQVYAYDILGPVVNQASRVEGITKFVGVPILVTEDVARQLPPDRMLTRRVARFLPAGVETAVDLYTVDPTPTDPLVREAIICRHALHAQALVAFEAGRWNEAFDLLHPIVKEDAAARYIYTLALQRNPPRDWQGIIEMTTK